MNISVLIPTYNRKNLLKRALESVLSQEDFFEIIVVDDFSSDGTEEFMRGFDDPRIIYLRQDKNRGVNATRNFGLKHTKGEWVVFLDDDDEFLPNAIETIKTRVKSLAEDFNVAYFNSIIDTGKEKFEGGFQFKNLKYDTSFYDPNYEETMTKFGLRGDCKPVFRRELFDNKKYLFPETVNGFESYTMNIIAKDRKGIRYFRDITTHIHQEPVLKDRLSINIPKKNPWPLFVLHFKQLFQHWRFYLPHLKHLFKKIKEMFKLLVRSVFKFV